MNERLPSLLRTRKNRLRGFGLAPTPEEWGRSTLAQRVELCNPDIGKLIRILNIQKGYDDFNRHPEHALPRGERSELYGVLASHPELVSGPILRSLDSETSSE